MPLKLKEIVLTKNVFVFDKTMTEVSKGIAIMLMLWHHLFHTHTEFSAIVLKSANASKVCVAIFLILSGYGLEKSLKGKNVDYLQFYKKRLTKIYFNFWYVAVIFIFLGVYIFDKSLSSVFTYNEHLELLFQMAGIHAFFFPEDYNSTWWFISLIIVYYLLFPFIRVFILKLRIISLLFFATLMFLPYIPYFTIVQIWLLPFALGIYLSYFGILDKFINKLLQHKKISVIILLSAILLLAYYRAYGVIFTGFKIDWLFGSSIIAFSIILANIFPKTVFLLKLLGIHSFNIFLIHTFYYETFFSDFIYSFNQPIIIFLVLLILSFITSVFLEKSKVFFQKTFSLPGVKQKI